MATDWRWSFLHFVGPGGYPGFLLGDWLRLLRDNRFAVSPACLVRVASASLSTLVNSAIAPYERWRYGAEVDQAAVVAPLFVLGHWRSGTTHLHQLLAVDERFAFPNLYQCSLPHIFLSTAAASSRLTGFAVPRIRPFDNVRQTWETPYEDEMANAVLSLRSPYLSGLFPQRAEFYDRYLTFRGVPEQEIDEWRAGLLLFLKKLSWKYQRPLVVKSPPHTCRVRLLLDLFPDAKFVHIHRNPFTVFQSTMHMLDRTLKLTRFQNSDQVDWADRTLHSYREMYDTFFEERSFIPEGCFHEVRFEDVEKDPVGQMHNIYEALDLPDFVEVESRLQEYVDDTTGYRKNEFPELSADLQKRIVSEWRPCLEEWRYPHADGAMS